MTDKEIIKALEHCCDGESECEFCPFNEKCEKEGERLITYALDLIKRQKAEIEHLQQLLDAAIAGQETLQNYFLSKDTPDGIRLKQNKETGEWEKFEPYMTIDCMTEEDFNAIEIAVKKQQARKPKPIPCAVGKSLFDCPYCEKTMSYKQYHHCTDCGQKLDWSENDGRETAD